MVRTRQRYEQVQALKTDGKNVATVARELRLAPGTARRYYRAASVDEVVAGTLTGWPSKLDDHKPYLHQRWNSGCTNIGQLCQRPCVPFFCPCSTARGSDTARPGRLRAGGRPGGRLLERAGCRWDFCPYRFLHCRDRMVLGTGSWRSDGG